MKPLSKYNSRCPEALPSKCIEWNGPNISCLDICHNDVLTDVVYSIATKVCELAGDLDLNTLDLGCLIDICDTCPTEKNLKVILQLMLDNDCKLKELIDDIIRAINEGGAGGGGVVLNLNYRCIEKFDDFGNPIPQDLNQTLQSIINELCTHKTQLANHESRLTIIETTYCKPPCGSGGGDSYVEPVITLCTSDIPKQLSLAVIDLGNNYCDYKPIVGLEPEVLAAISKQPNLTTDPHYTDYLADGLIINADYNSMADSEFNQWILLKSLLARVNTIETTCCAPKCEDIHIGFDAVYDETAEEYVLSFTYAAGTEIPVGVEDCGSVMTLTDSAGKTKTIPITIENGLIFTISNIAPLKTSDPISVTIKTCFTFPNGLNCKDCIGGVLPALQPCGFCKLCVAGGTAGDTLIVSYNKNGTVYSQSLKPGDCIYFENADVVEILSINATATGMTLVSDPNNPCDAIDIPDVTEAICWYFPIPVNNTVHSYFLGISTVDNTSLFDIVGADNELYRYNKLYTFLEPTGITMSGTAIGISGTSVAPDFVTIVPNPPVVASSSIITNNRCRSFFDIRWFSNNVGGPVNAPNIDGHGPSAGADLVYLYEPHTSEDGSVTNEAGEFGVMLKILGQPTTVKPTIELKDPISNALVLIEGRPIDDCDCASV